MKKSKIAERLAHLCALWQIAARPRPLRWTHPDGDDAADASWERMLLGEEGVQDLARLRRWIETVPLTTQAAAIRLLRDGGRAGDHARREALATIARRADWRPPSYGALTVHAFGVDWRAAGEATVTP